jgi:predicted DCC family thiol-disulfide oxidoreductase YuxK
MQSRKQIRRVLKAFLVIDRLFGVDTRSLALFRVGSAVLLLVELVYRMRNVTAYYTDSGVMPRELVIDNFQSTWSFSFHLINGAAPFQLLLLVIALVAATSLLLGYRTRLATFASWLLLASLFVRNPSLQSSGDVLLLLLLFWGMFLPLGAQWSVDRALATNDEGIPVRILSVASAALLIQAVLVYVFTRALKTGAPWHDGTAAIIALNWDQGTTALGRFMLHFPEFLRTATHGVMLLELIGPILLFLPFYTPLVRLAVIPLFFLLHLSFAMMMVLFTFPYVSMVSLLPFLPPQFWDLIPDKRGEGVTIFYDGGCGFCKTMVRLIRTFFILPQAALLPAQDDAEANGMMREQNSWVVRDAQGRNFTRAEAMRHLLAISPILSPFHHLLRSGLLLGWANRAYGWIARHRPTVSLTTGWLKPRPLKVTSPIAMQLAAAFFLIYIIVWNFAGLLEFNAPLRPVANLFQVHQNWAMFAPFPKTDDGWFVIPGELRNGTKVDLFRALIAGRDEELSWEKPRAVASMFPNVYWRKYFENLESSGDKDRYNHLAYYLQRAWNASQPSERQLARLDVYYMLEDSTKLTSPPEKIHHWEHHFSE